MYAMLLIFKALLSWARASIIWTELMKWCGSYDVDRARGEQVCLPADSLSLLWAAAPSACGPPMAASTTTASVEDVGLWPSSLRTSVLTASPVDTGIAVSGSTILSSSILIFFEADSSASVQRHHDVESHAWKNICQSLLMLPLASSQASPSHNYINSDQAPNFENRRSEF